MRPLRHFTCLGIFLATQSVAQTETPLSAIEWLSESVEAIEQSSSAEAPVSVSIITPSVTVSALDGPVSTPIGLVAPDVSKLPHSLWSASEAHTLSTLISALATPELPALRSLFATLLVAEADAPRGQSGEYGFLLTRVDKLLDLGDLNQAQALLDAAGPDQPALFRRFFDVTLLTGHENTACEMMQSRPTVAPTYPARIFCLARNGDWPAAALTLHTHKALGDITDEEDLLLSLFLDPEVAELHVDIPDPTRVSPLIFRMREAIGENLTTSDLPLAFAHADLRDIAGWKAQLEAAERLARSGSLPAETLRALYTSRRPSASGGVWDRARLIQKFEAALDNQDANALADMLPDVWNTMTQINAEAMFAEIYASQLARYQLTGHTASLAYEISLIAQHDFLPVYETFGNPFLSAVARGSIDDVQPQNPQELAVKAAFIVDRVPSDIIANLSADKTGEALLYAIKLGEAGMNGDLRSMTDAISMLRALGHDEIARATALQFLILERKI